MPGLTIHLGVTEMPYSAAYTPQAKKLKPGHRKQQAAYAKGKTTGDIAEILESKYGIMHYFAAKYMPEIIKAVETAYAGAVKNMMAGGTVTVPSAQAMSTIERQFKNFLAMKEMDGQTGVPTAASLRGVSHRFKKPYARRASRPSFIDTGLYQASFRAWMD
jgi:hypothetical protein